MSSCVAQGGTMAKSVNQTMEELRREMTLWKQKVKQLRAEGQFSNIDIIERWIADAEAVLSRWDNAGLKN